jgi:hypothetical protein
MKVKFFIIFESTTAIPTLPMAVFRNHVRRKMIVIHDTSPHKAESLSHEGKVYEQLGDRGTLGHGVFNLPESVAFHMLQFPQFKMGDPPPEAPIVVNEPQDVHSKGRRELIRRGYIAKSK